MPQKTIYVKDEHLKLWDEVKDLIGDESLSEVVVEGLKRVIDARKASLDGLQRIELEIGESERPKPKIAFYGRELASNTDDERPCWHTAYVTKKGNILIYSEDGDSKITKDYKLFKTFSEASKEKYDDGEPKYSPEFLAETAEELGESYIIELDI